MTTPELITRQLELEAESVDLGIQRYQGQSKTACGNQRDIIDQPTGHMLARLWVEPLASALDDTFSKKSNSGQVNAARAELAATGLSTYDQAYLAIRALLSLTLDQKANDQHGAPLMGLAVKLGRTFVEEARCREFKETHGYYVKAVMENHKLTKRNAGSIIQAISRGKDRVCGETDFDVTLSNSDAYRMGMEVIRVLLVVCSDWFHRTTGTSVHKRSCIILTPKAIDWLRDRAAFAEVLAPVHRPMVVPPLDWTSNGSGGYLSTLTHLIRKGGNPKMTHKTKPSLETLRAINVAQGTAWRINERVLKVAKQLEGKDIAGLPSFMDVPPEDAEPDRELEPEAAKAYRKTQMFAMQENIKRSSKMTATTLVLELAEDFAEFERIYFPHKFDWRGRLYPVPSLLNPQGADLSKSLLEFADAKPLGLEGYNWLAIHCANTFGKDKLPFQERINWTEDNEDDMIRCAADPFHHRMWAEADDPFKFLACCFEWADLVQFEGSPRDFLSRIPVALDGTCSGLQHFSALLRDERGGASVNLVPAPKPSDIYAEVAEEVLKAIEAEGDCWQARIWNGLIDRGTCKRGTMTQPYSVTKRGMADQLVDLVASEDEYHEFPERVAFETARMRDGYNDEEWLALEGRPSRIAACCWLANILGDAINTVVVASEEGRVYLSSIAALYAEADQFWSWTTPLGMEITQGYRSAKEKTIVTFFGSVRVRLKMLDDSKELPKSKNKTRNGSSPNFIHSLDATHLMMTVLECKDLGGIKSFALVHDSFGVHAGSVPVLAQALRNTFVTMYQGDLLQQLMDRALEELPEEYHKRLPEVPKMGTLNLEMVRRSQYLFM